LYIEQEVDYVIDIATSIFPQDSNIAFGTGTHKIERFDNKTLLKGGSLLEKDLIAIFESLLEQEINPFNFSDLSERSITTNAQHLVSNELAKGEDDIDFNNLAQTLNDLQAQDANTYVYLPEVGNSYFASYSLKVRHSILGRSWLTNPWYGAMGTALPYARVVAQRIKSQQIAERAVVIIGDGGFHFQLNELIHFLKDKSDVTIVYMRNNVFHLGKSGDGAIYHCNDSEFDVHSLVKAYQGKSKTCTSVSEFKAYFKACGQQTGVSLIEVPAKPIEARQSNELKLLNLYIKSKNGQVEAVKAWQALTQ